MPIGEHDLRNGRLPLSSKSEYHADTTHVSHSSMEVFRESVPTFHGRYVTKTIPPPPPSGEMELGTAFHAMILEPDSYRDKVAVIPRKWDMRKNIDKEESAAFLAENAGKTIISQKDEAAVLAMRESVFSNPDALPLLECPGEPEFAVQWQCVETDVWCKAMYDRLCATEFRVILDVKTADDPTPDGFARACARYGYGRQAWWYVWGASIALNEPARFVFLVVGNKPPYECVLYELEPEDFEVCGRQVMSDLRRLRDCRLFGQWHSRWRGVNRLRLPRYALTDD